MPEEIIVTETSSEIAVNDLVTRFTTQNQAQYLAVASLCVVMYEIVITFDQEVEYIWRSRPRITLISVLFALNRWWVPLAFVARISRFAILHPSLKVSEGYATGMSLQYTEHLTSKTCGNIMTFTLSSQVGNVFVFEAALAIRVWALYDKSRGVLYLLFFLLGGSLVSSAVVFGIGIKDVRTTPSPEDLAGQRSYARLLDRVQTHQLPFVTKTPFLTGCNSVPHYFPRHLNSIFFSAMFLEVVFFVMTIRQVIRYGRWQKSPIMTHIAQTGTMFFSVGLVALLFALVGGFVPYTSSAAQNSNFIIAILSINCSRFILSIRDVAQAPSPSLHIPSDIELGPVPVPLADPNCLGKGAISSETKTDDNARNTGGKCERGEQNKSDRGIVETRGQDSLHEMERGGC